MQQYSDADLILIWALRSAALMEKLVFRLEPQDFSAVEEEGHRALWTVLQEFYKKYRAVPSAQLAQKLLETVRPYLDEAGLASCQRILDISYQITEEDIRGGYHYVLEIAQNFLRDRKIRPLATALGAVDAADMDRYMQRLVAVEASTRLSAGKVMDEIFTPQGVYLQNEHREPTGVTPVDLLLGGGTRAGEVYGILGPTGNGKTTLALQIFCEAVKNERHPLYLTYEQPVIPAIANRIYARLADIPRHRIKDKQLEELAGADRKRLLETLDRYKEHLHVADMVRPGVGLGGVEEIRALVRDYANRGVRVDMIIVDQHLPLVDRMIASGKWRNEDRRVLLQNTVNEFIALSSEFSLATFLIHQTAPSEARKRATVKPLFTDAAECRSWAFWMTSCLAMSRLDQKGLCWLAAAKSREAAPDALIVRLDGDRGLFLFEPGRYIVSAGEFVDVTDKETRIKEDGELDDDVRYF